MGEIEEHRYICKICSKICVSGKSLGGHMRIHLALISASKKAAKEKGKIKIEDDQLSAEKIKDSDGNTDADQNANYQLRENPKKSWRVSDVKHGLTKKSISCADCGKGFPSLKALSGHMRCHSMKNKDNKEVHHCEKCGRGFDSIRAVFGHMKSHSKKSRMHNECTDSLSDLENLCPVRRKRSRIGYKSAPNASDSSVSEFGEAEEAAATCLIMLSRGVRDFVKCETESSDDDDCAYLGAESFYRSKQLSGTLLCCSSGYSKAIADQNESEFDDLDDQKVVSTEVSDDEMLGVENEMKVDFDRVLKPEKSFEFDDLRIFDSIKSAEFESNYGKKAICSVHDSGSEKNSCLYEANVESTSEGGMSMESRKSKEHECLICFKVFPSGQALGGHKRAHFNGLIESKKKESMAMIMNQEVAEIQEALDLNFPAAVEEGSKDDVGFHPWGIERSHEAEALIFSN